VEVVLDVDLAVQVAADEHERVDLDHVLLGQLLDGVPIGLGGVGIGVGRDVEIDRDLALLAHGDLPFVGWTPVSA
jgi:hypothetical protein